ncbi:hypothetical protein JCM11491_006099 [Sporobolomyces phaffii]
MGFFSSSSSAKTAEPANDSAAPSRSERKACWDSRDLYFSCLDKQSVSVPGQEGDKCAKEDGAYRDKCAASWVDYFNKRRVLQLRQDMMERRAAEQQADQAKPRITK